MGIFDDKKDFACSGGYRITNLNMHNIKYKSHYFIGHMIA